MKNLAKKYVIDKAGEAGNSAHSDIVQLNNKARHVLYKKNNYSSIIFKVVKW